MDACAPVVTDNKNKHCYHRNPRMPVRLSLRFVSDGEDASRKVVPEEMHQVQPAAAA